MSQTIETIIDRIKNLSIFNITVDLPDEFTFKGIVPFDVKIIGREATFTLYALNFEEASQKINNYVSTRE